MKTESRGASSTPQPEAMQIDEQIKVRSTPTKSSASQSQSQSQSQSNSIKHEDIRDDTNVKETSEEREGPPKKPTPRKSSKSNSRRSAYDSNPNVAYQHPPYAQGGHYPPPGARPYAPPPPHYGYDPHYRPPHPHSYPPPMHHGQPPGGYAYGPPPPNYHPYAGYPAPMPYPPPPHPMPSSYPQISDNASMASSKTKSSNKSKYARKKRTIDQHQQVQQQTHYNHTKVESMFDDQHQPQLPGRRGHRRNFSSASTASTLSAGELSLSSSVHDRDKNDNPLTRASPKRRRGHDSNPISVGISFDEQSTSHTIRRTSSNASAAASAVRFQKLSVNDNSKRTREDQTKIFLTLSTSPINTQDVDSTPISKNKMKKQDLHHLNYHGSADDEDIDRFMARSRSMDSAAAIDEIIDRHGNTPTPPMNSSGTNVLTDQHLLNRHLRGQTFTPVPSCDRDSPPKAGINNGSFSAIQPQLSWSIAGDAPSLGDLAEWEEDRNKRPSSTTSHVSSSSRAIALSPSSFTMWKELDPNSKHRTLSRDESLRLSMLSPQSDDNGDEGGGGATTPLPFFLGSSSHGAAEERENAIRGSFSNNSEKSGHNEAKYGQPSAYHRVPENVHSIFVNRSSGSASKQQRSASKSSSNNRFFPQAVRGDSSGRGGMRLPPTPVYSEHDYGRSPLGRDGPPEGSYYPQQQQHYMGPPPHSHMPDRVRNLRGRAPAHHAPMPLQVPPPVQSHHTLTSPMGMPNKMWGIPHPSPHHMAPQHHPSPQHHQMSELMNPSKRKCVSLKPPIPSKFQGDMEKCKGAPVPEFTSLVNYPAHMSQKQSVNLPEGMRCCVMCGQACPCSNSSKTSANGSSNNSHGSSNGNKKHHPSSMSSSSNSKKEMSSSSSNSLEKQGGFAIIPTQNKGLCTLCDVNVWVVCQSGLEIKWCKGCKNFRPWAAFGDKGLATKCLRCRERQREKYALQKEEKEKARVPASSTMAKHI